MNLATQKEREQKWHEELDIEIRCFVNTNSIVRHAYSASLSEKGIDKLLFLKRAVVLLAKDNENKAEQLRKILRME